MGCPKTCHQCDLDFRFCENPCCRSNWIGPPTCLGELHAKQREFAIHSPGVPLTEMMGPEGAVTIARKHFDLERVQADAAPNGSSNRFRTPLSPLAW
jgi:hypothetical protein